MKNLATLLIGLLSAFMAFSQGWTPLQSNTTEDLNAVYFIDAMNGFAVGNNGTICSTIDGGENWSLQNAGTTNNITSVYFSDLDTGFVAANKQLLKTIDGGTTWTIQDTITNGTLTQISFSSIDTGFVIGDGNLLKTVDGGVNWTKHSSASGFGAKSFWAINSQNLYTCGQYFLTLKSTNGGQNWNPIVNISAPGNMESIFFTNDTTGYFVGGNFAQGFTNSRFMKTTDGGETFTNTGLGNFHKWLLSIFFTDSSNGYMTAGDGTIFKTTNAGSSWNELNSTVSTALNAIYFPDSQTGYTVGSNGVILKTTTGGLGLNESSKGNGITIYPNPTTDELIISSESSLDKIELIDNAGNVIFNTEQSINTISTVNIASGIYYVKVTVAGNTITQKIVKH